MSLRRVLLVLVLLSLVPRIERAEGVTDAPAGAPGFVPPPVYRLPPNDRPRFSAVFTLGPCFRSLYGVRIVGGDVHLALGARLSKNLALYGDLGVFLGATDQGLVTTHVRPAFIAAGIIGKFRLFGGVEAGVFQVRRVTSPYQMDTLSFGPTLGVSYDLAKVSRATMSLAVVGTAARIPFASDDATRHFPAVLEVALRLGIRVPG